MNIKKFRKPPVIMRPTPFWAINDKIIPQETAKQMDDMLSVGLGGGFFHARHGLITEYLGEEWFSCMKAALEVARKKDGYLWLYDEDLWPSGNAGGQVAATKEEYRKADITTYLLFPDEPLPSLGEDDSIRHCYVIEKREGIILEKLTSITLDKIDSFSNCERLVVVRRYAPKTPWWSGESYVNLLNPEAVHEFIKLTHEVYHKQLGNEFGKRVPGIFTDEPSICPSWLCGLPWYEGLPDKYYQNTGRNFWDDLPYIFFDGKEARHIRLLIYRTMQQQFLESYSKPIYQWCEEHKIAHTGHYNAEDTFLSQIANHCGGVMAHYKYQQIPGIDHLCRKIEDMLLTCKQVSSAARQLGRKTVLTEIFGVTRHTNTFQDFKWLGDYDLVHGANFFCPHLTWYSGKGRRKRDYPPVWNYQQTYWKELHVLNDYFTRIAYAITQGRPDVPLLLLHSIESAIAGDRTGVNATRSGKGIPVYNWQEADVLDSAMRKALETILNTGFDCDLGDENYIDESGEVKGKRFIIGKMSYKIVVIPPSTTWREKTVSLLEKFVKNGGIVIILGKPPEEIDGIENKERWQKVLLKNNVYSLPNSVETIQNIISSLQPSSYKLQGSDGKYYTKTYLQHRINGNEEVFFIVNSDRENERHYVLTIENPKSRKLLRWDAVSGEVFLAATKKEKERLVYHFSLPPAGSLLLTLSPSPGNIPKEKKMPDLKDAGVVNLPSTFEFERKDDNILVLDRISVSYDGRNFSEEEPEWRVRKRIAKHFGVEAALQWQPWVAIRKGIFEGKGGNIILRYRFYSDVEKPKSFLVIEDMQKGRVSINGQELPFDRNKLDWHWDRSFKKIEITDYVKKGENTVDFSLHYDFLTEVEAAYIVGDFGVEMVDPYRGRIVKENKYIRTGSWVGQGYPFYSGRMVYKASFNMRNKKKKIFLKIVNPSGILFKVRVNAIDAGNILWSPYILEITPFIKRGKNSISVELVSSLQNSWGPLHEKDGDDNRWVGPNAFEDESFIREELSLFNYGIGGIKILCW